MSIVLARRAAGGDFSPEVAAWLCAGFAKHLAGDDLDQALGLDRTNRLRERNRALMEAAALLESGGGTWELAGRLAQAIRRFECRVHPMIAQEPKASLAPLDRLLFDAFATGQRIPRTQRKLYELLR